MTECLNEVIRIIFFLVIAAFMLCLFKTELKTSSQWLRSFFIREEDNQEERIRRTDDEQKISNDMYSKHREDILKRQLSNSEGYDKAILSLSSAALALSIAAVRFIIPSNQDVDYSLLKLSWYLFFFVIASSITAYIIGNLAIKKEISMAYDYYIKGIESALTNKNWLSILNDVLNILTGIIFLIAIFLAISFITTNL